MLLWVKGSIAAPFPLLLLMGVKKKGSKLLLLLFL